MALNFNPEFEPDPPAPPEEADFRLGHPMFVRRVVAYCRACGSPIYDDDGWVSCASCGEQRRRKEQR